MLYKKEEKYIEELKKLVMMVDNGEISNDEYLDRHKKLREKYFGGDGDGK